MARSVSGKTTRTPTRATSKSPALKPRATKTASKASTPAAKPAKAKATSKAAASKPRTATKAAPRKTSTKTAALGVKTATIANPDRGEPMLASAPMPEIARGGAGLTNIEALGDQTLNLPPVFRRDSVETSLHARVSQHEVRFGGNLMSGSASSTTSFGAIRMSFDTRIPRRNAKWVDATFDLNGREVRLFRGDLNFTDDEPSSAIVYKDDFFGEDTYGFFGVLPFSRMAPIVQILGGYPDSLPTISFYLTTADDDVSVTNYRLFTSMREQEPRRGSQKKK